MVKLREKIDEITLQLSDAEMQLRNKQIQVIAVKENQESKSIEEKKIFKLFMVFLLCTVARGSRRSAH